VKGAAVIKKTATKKVGLNLGPKTSLELASIGIETQAALKKEGWRQVFLRLIAKYPERLNLNMAAGLIGAQYGVDWRAITPEHKQEAKDLIKSLKPKKPARPRRPPADDSFVEYLIKDQLEELRIRSRRMFGGFGLYQGETFFGLVWDGTLFLKTDEESRKKYVEQGMACFTPSQKQCLPNYYQVPADISENIDDLLLWVREAIRLAKGTGGGRKVARK